MAKIRTKLVASPKLGWVVYNNYILGVTQLVTLGVARQRMHKLIAMCCAKPITRASSIKSDYFIQVLIFFFK